MSARILLLHGALGSSVQFERLREHLDVACDTLDFIGHGVMPDVEESWTIDLFANQLAQYIQMQPKPLPIFGYSMGGYVAMMVALQQPELVPRLVTLGTKLDWNVEGALRDTAKLTHDKTVQMMRDLGGNPRLTPRLISELQIPIRLMVGDRDSMVSVEETLAYHRAIPGSEFAVLPKTKHLLDKVDHARLAREVTQFLLA